MFSRGNSEIQRNWLVGHALSTEPYDTRHEFMKSYERYWAYSSYLEDNFEGDRPIYSRREGKEECSPAELPFWDMIAPCGSNCLLKLEVLTFSTPNFTCCSLYMFY